MEVIKLQITFPKTGSGYNFQNNCPEKGQNIPKTAQNVDYKSRFNLLFSGVINYFPVYKVSDLEKR